MGVFHYKNGQVHWRFSHIRDSIRSERAVTLILDSGSADEEPLKMRIDYHDVKAFICDVDKVFCEIEKDMAKIARNTPCMKLATQEY